MAVAGLKPIWVGTGLFIVCLWALLQSSNFSTTTITKHFLTASVIEASKEAAAAAGGAVSKPEVITFEKNNSSSPNKAEAEYCASKGLVLPTNSSRISNSDSSKGGLSSLQGSVTAPEDRPLILLAYSESPFARENLQFFLDHALHSAADFIFILNGETDADQLIFPPAQAGDTSIHSTVDIDPLPPNAKDKLHRRQEKTPEQLFEDAKQRLKEEQAVKLVPPPPPKELPDVKNMLAAAESMKASLASATGTSQKAESTKAASTEPLSAAELEEEKRIGALKKAQQEKIAYPLPRRHRNNVKIVRRGNLCFDLGAHAEVLNTGGSGPGWFDSAGPIPEVPIRPLRAGERDTYGPQYTDLALRSRYKKYILMNASIRGPFVPPWSNTCWSDAYLNRVTDVIKLVGMTYNCNKRRGHIQSMIWATDYIGLQTILEPQAIGSCPATMLLAIEGEVNTTPHLRSKGYDVDSFISVFHSHDRKAKAAKLTAMLKENPHLDMDTVKIELERPANWWKEECGDHDDFLKPVQAEESVSGYYGTFVHPYETLWFKSHRGIEDLLMRQLTSWVDGAGYESYDYCH